MPSKDPKKRYEALKRWRASHSEQWLFYSRKYQRERYQKDPSRIAKLNRKLKQQVIDAYGGKCNCCAETILDFLTIDHVNNDGAEHRRAIGKDLYRWLKQNNFPQEGFQCLCWNCQWGKRLSGVCPHQLTPSVNPAILP